MLQIPKTEVTKVVYTIHNSDNRSDHHQPCQVHLCNCSRTNTTFLQRLLVARVPKSYPFQSSTIIARSLAEYYPYRRLHTNKPVCCFLHTNTTHNTLTGRQKICGQIHIFVMIFTDTTSPALVHAKDYRLPVKRGILEFRPEFRARFYSRF